MSNSTNNWVSEENTDHQRKQALKNKKAYDDLHKGKKRVLNPHPTAIRALIEVFE